MFWDNSSTYLNAKKGKKRRKNCFTFTVTKVEGNEAPEARSDDGEVRIGNSGEKRAGSGLREVHLDNAGESLGHPTEHGGPRPGAQPPALRALQSQPTLAYEAESVSLLLRLQLRKNRPQFVIGEDLVDAERRAFPSEAVGRHGEQNQAGAVQEDETGT